MRMYDLIIKKRNGGALTEAELGYIAAGAVDGSIPDYQLSAFLMAVYYRGMTRAETVALTLAMARSGDMVDLTPVAGVTADKHSTGGVGDKTTLIVAPVVAACGVKVAKMSGRGLGHTGGTVDKLEAIPGFRTELTRGEFIDTVNRVGVCVVGQSGNLAPADKKLYALRDVTGTVENVSLIASSIMSKKLAAGADCIVLDVKAGSGAFMKTVDAARELARVMVDIGTDAGRNTVALITDMNRPLGRAIGNALEVQEAVEVLNGGGPEDLMRMCMELAGNMLYLAGIAALDECVALAYEAVAERRALAKFKQMVTAQGGDLSAPGLYARAGVVQRVLSPVDGYIEAMDTEGCGVASVLLGAGRETKDSDIDHSAGIILHKKPGEYVKRGELLAELHTNAPERIKAAEETLLSGISFNDAPPPETPLIYERVC